MFNNNHGYTDDSDRDGDDYDSKAYGNREEDTMAALECLENALDLLAHMGSDDKVDQVAELVGRAHNLINRCYGEVPEWGSEEPLNFNEDE